MFNLFTHPIELPKHTYLSRDYLQVLHSMKTLQAYYKQSGARVHNQHIIVILINVLMNGYDDPDKFIRSVRAQLRTVNILGLNTEYRPGIIMDDPFIGGLHKCMIYLEDGTSSRDVPVKVIHHPFTHINLPLLDGKMVERDLGADMFESYVSTYSISATSLMMRYRQYLATTSVDEAFRGPAHFVHSVVLPMMTPSFFQLSLWNRLWYPIAEKPVVDAPNRNPVKTLNLLHASIKTHNNVKLLRGTGVVSYAEVLAWQFRRGYGLGMLGVLPKGVNIYRPTAAYAWFSRVEMIRGLLLIGQHRMRMRQGDYIRELNYQLQLTLNGKLIHTGVLRDRIIPQIKSMTDALDFVN